MFWKFINGMYLISFGRNIEASLLARVTVVAGQIRESENNFCEWTSPEQNLLTIVRKRKVPIQFRAHKKNQQLPHKNDAAEK